MSLIFQQTHVHRQESKHQSSGKNGEIVLIVRTDSTYWVWKIFALRTSFSRDVFLWQGFLLPGRDGSCPTWITVYHQWVECRSSGLLPPPIPLNDQSVAITFSICWNCSRDLTSDQNAISWSEWQRIPYWSAGVNEPVLVCCWDLFCSLRIFYGVGLAFRIVGILHDNVILKLSISPISRQCLPQYVYILFLKVLVNKLTWNLYCKNVVLQFQGNNRFKPRLKTICRNYIFDDLETIIPYVNVW